MAKKRKTSRGSKNIQSNKNTRKVNWLLCLLLSIFLGWIGVDRFVMGRVGTGILKLVTLGGLGVWWLIDLILIASKYDFDGITWVEN